MPTVLNTSYIIKELREAAGDLNPVRDEALTPVDVLLAAAARLEELSERRPVDRTLVDRLESRLQEAVKERDRLAEAVMHYSYHDSECATMGGKAAPCSCGYDELYDKCAALAERRRELASVLGRSPNGDPCDCIEPCISGRPHDKGTYCRRTGSDRALTERSKP